MTLQQLRYFQAACKYKNITYAAESLHVSQSSITLAIKNLESEFNVTLIRRSKVGFALTEDGEELLKLSDKLLEHSENVEKYMKDIGNNKIQIRLGIPPMSSAVIIPEIHSEFLKNCPDVLFEITEGGRYELSRLLDDNLVDMAFFPHDEEVSSEYESVYLMRFETVCCVGKEHRFGDRKRITAKELENENIVLFFKSFFQNKRVSDMFSKANISPKVSFETSQVSTVKELVRKNISVGFIFSELLENESDLIGIPLIPPIYTNISLVWKKNKKLTPSMKKYIKFIKNLSEEK